MNEAQQEFYGQVNYNAYCESRGWVGFSGQPLPQWEEVKPEIQAGWRAAAIKVLASLPSDKKVAQ